VTFQDSRRELAAVVEGLAGEGWQVTTATEPDISHKTIVVGHPLDIESEAFGSWKATLPVTLWVSEADDADAVDALYQMISPGPLSLLDGLEAALRTTVRGRDVGRRDEGPSGFLAADVDVIVRIDT
jgi:hypothetical protein